MLEMTFMCGAARSLYACWSIALCVVLLAHCMHAGDDILCGAARSLYARWR